MQKEAEKKIKTQELTYRDTTNVEHEVFVYTSNNWCHRNSNKWFKEKFGRYIQQIHYIKKTVMLWTSHIIRKVLQSET